MQGKKPMADEIKTGTILMEEGALLPNSLRLESEPFSSGWRLVKDLDGNGLARRISEAGWTFFYMAGEMRASGFGINARKATRRAIKRVLEKLGSEKFNCLEVRQLALRRFLGLAYVRVTAYSRHVRKAPGPRTLRNGTDGVDV
jgi:hypothetical protein